MISLQGGGTKGGRVRQRGSALVEQALVLTFLLTVMFGIIDCGRALYTYHFVSNAAREATRWASVRSETSLLGTADNSAVKAFVSNVSGMGLDPSLISTSTNFLAPPHGSPRCPPGTNLTGCVVEVQVNYDYKFFFPFLPNGTVTMTSKSELVITQ